MRFKINYPIFVLLILVGLGFSGLVYYVLLPAVGDMALMAFWIIIGASAALSYKMTKNKYETLANIAVRLRSGKVNAVCVNDAKDETKHNFIYFYTIDKDNKVSAVAQIDCPYTYSKLMADYDLRKKYKVMVDYLNTGNDYYNSSGKFDVVDQSREEFFDESAKHYLLN